MGAKTLKAVEYMSGSYSCSQSVLCAFADDARLTHEDAKGKKNCRSLLRRQKN